MLRPLVLTFQRILKPGLPKPSDENVQIIGEEAVERGGGMGVKSIAEA
jgi:hypothetical protein